jgi:hypothetical protein
MTLVALGTLAPLPLGRATLYSQVDPPEGEEVETLTWGASSDAARVNID